MRRIAQGPGPTRVSPVVHINIDLNVSDFNVNNNVSYQEGITIGASENPIVSYRRYRRFLARGP
jgi:hypothetical protein